MENKTKVFQMPSQITSIRPLSDNSASVTIHTQEISDSDFVILRRFLNKVGWFLFKEDKKGITIAGRFKPKDNSMESQVGGLQYIPKNWIRKRKNINL